MSDADRLTAAETALAHAEAAIQDLSDEVLRQDGEIAGLKREIRRLQALIERLEDRLDGDGGAE
ncbi:MAG: SlyX family protein [Solirubrobacterales bacterium]